MLLFGLTGGIGMGKSTGADWFLRAGHVVADTDAIAREVVEPGQPALAEVREAFGAEVIAADGRLDRHALGRIVFSDSDARLRLEGILHPRIRAVWRARVAAWRAEDRALGVVVIPLLYETRAETEFDAVLCVACTAATQRARLSQRGWNDAQIAGRLAAQWPVERKIALADYLVWTEGNLEVLADQLARIVAHAQGRVSAAGARATEA